MAGENGYKSFNKSVERKKTTDVGQRTEPGPDSLLLTDEKAPFEF